jgi:hypothetical protein
MFLSDLLTFAKEQARIERIDYFDPRYPRADEIKAWQHDKNCRDYERKCLFRKFPARLKNAHNEKLVPGSYGRLKISEGDIDYTVGQYAPREIYGAVLDYLQQTNSI